MVDFLAAVRAGDARATAEPAPLSYTEAVLHARPDSLRATTFDGKATGPFSGNTKNTTGWASLAAGRPTWQNYEYEPLVPNPGQHPSVLLVSEPLRPGVKPPNYKNRDWRNGAAPVSFAQGRPHKIASESFMRSVRSEWGGSFHPYD